MIARSLAALALLLAACASRAAIPPPRTPLAATPIEALAPPPGEPWPEAEPSLALTSRALDNGLGVYVAPSGHRDGLASVIFLSRAGALHDARVPPAVTHALSRLLLRATRVGDEEVDEHLEREGFAPSIAAGDDGLLVQAVLATDALPRYLEALSAALRGPALRPDDLARVREDDGELLDGRLATPYGVLDDRLASMLYAQNDPRGYTLAAWLGDLRALTIEAVTRRHRELLDPAQCAVVITGDVREDDVLPLVERAFGALEGAPSPPSVSPPRYADGGARGLGVARNLMRSYVRLIEHAPGLAHEDHAAFLVLEQLLGGMFTSRLNLLMRERAAASYGVHARYLVSGTSGRIEIETAVAPAHAASVVRAIVGELWRVRGEAEGGVDASELAVAKTRARELVLAQLDTTRGLAAVIAQRVLGGQEPGAVLEVLRRIDELDPRDVEAAARRWLRPDRAPIAVISGDGVLRGAIQAAGVGEWELVAAPERRRR